jgi:transposase-like protein
MDWIEIKTEYVSGKATYRELAKKYGVSFSTLQKRAKEEKWAESRRKYRDKVVTRALARTCTRDAQRLAKLQRSAMRLTEDLEKVLSDPNLPYLHTASTTTGMTDELLHTPNGKNLLAIAKALREATAAMRDLYGINTRAETFAQEQATERLKIEREKLEMEKQRMESEGKDTVIEVKLPPELEDFAK